MTAGTGTGLALYTPQETVALAEDVWKLASKLALTEFVPKGMRDRPEAVLATMLKGAELGLPLMTSLAQIFNLDGRIGMYAELMRALVFSRGHEFVIDESTSQKCQVSVRRAGADRWQTFTRTMDDAQKAGLAGKETYKKFPADMLLARVTAVACRAVFPDVLGGVSYSVEELTDGDVLEVSADAGVRANGVPAAAPATAKARRAATRGAPAAAAPQDPPPPADDRPRPPLPGEEDDIVDAEIVTASPPPADDGFPPIVDDDPPIPDPGDPPPLAGTAQIAIQMGRHGCAERADKLRACAQIVGRPIGSSNELTDDEIGLVLSFLAGLGDGVPFPFDDVVGEGVSPPVSFLPDGKAVDAPDGSLAAVVAGAPPSPQRSSGPRRVGPEDWSGDLWREFLGKRKVKVTEAMKEAKRLAAVTGVASPGTLDDVAGSGIADDLCGWAEDLALERKG